MQQPVEAAVHIGLRAVEIAHQRGANAFAAAGDPGLGGVDQGCESGGLRFQVRSAAIHHLARAGRGSLDPVGGDVRHAGHLVGGGAGRFLQLAQLAGQALGRGQRAGAGFVRHFGQRVQSCFQRVDAFAQRMAIVHDLRGHARAAFFERRDRCDQRVHARDQGGAGALGSFGAICSHLRAARDQFGGRFHIAAGRSAIAVEQFGLVLHRLPSGFELTRDPPEAQFEQIGLGAQRTRRFHIAARFSAAAAHQQHVEKAKQDERHGDRRDGVGPGSGSAAPCARRSHAPDRESDPPERHDEQGDAQTLDPQLGRAVVRRCLVNVENRLLQQQDVIGLRLRFRRDRFIAPEFDDCAAPCHFTILTAFPRRQMPRYQNLTQAR